MNFTLMLTKFWREWRFPVEFALLLALVFFLPLREAPKNLFWLAYVVTWLVNRAFVHSWPRDGAPRWGGRWDGWDTLFAVWISSGYAAALFAGIHTPEANEWGAVNDLVRYVSLAWCVRRAGYTRAQALLVLGMLAVSASLGTVEALWRWKITHAKKALELKSVGHVNHSAIYLTICAGIATGLMCALWRRASAASLTARAASSAVRAAAIFGAMALFLTAAVFMTNSRAAFVAVLLVVVLCVFFGFRAGRFGARAWAMVAAALVLALTLGGIGSVYRNIEHARTNNLTAERDLIWNRALVAAATHPWFGVGMDNFSRITDDRLQQWLAAQGKKYEPKDYRLAPHAHSLYLNTLTERGAAGLAVVLALLLAWGVRLWRLRPRMGSDGEETALWCAAFSGWLVTAFIGLANTTMHHEHAILALLTLSLWLAQSEAPPAQPA